MTSLEELNSPPFIAQINDAPTRFPDNIDYVASLQDEENLRQLIEEENKRYAKRIHKKE